MHADPHADEEEAATTLTCTIASGEQGQAERVLQAAAHDPDDQREEDEHLGRGQDQAVDRRSEQRELVVNAPACVPIE